MKAENIEINANDVEMLQLIPLEENIYRSKIIIKIEKIIKRFIDIIGSLFGIIMLIPLTIGIYMANLIVKDNGPVFYCQNRIGKDGKLFKMYKFRSMVVGAEKKLEEYLEKDEGAKKEYAEYKKLKNDPRITRVGRFIRKTSIDEFPQFINVLKGEMSLVGPRPYLPGEKEDMNGFYKYITSCKPGLTGFWQISGRSEVTFTDRLDMDMKCYSKHSLKDDIKILNKTVMKIVKKEGAI